jgi:hypothetical protein
MSYYGQFRLSAFSYWLSVFIVVVCPLAQAGFWHDVNGREYDQSAFFGGELENVQNWF